VGKESPDLVILDIGMPNLGGIETLCRLKHEHTVPPVLVLSAKDDSVTVREALKAGARGFIPKSAGTDEFIFAIRSVLKGQSYVSPSIAHNVLNSGQEGGEEGGSAVAVLSSREREVMKLLCEGKKNREIAKLLHVSPRTVDTHRANIMKKLCVGSNAELVQIALREGIIE
jgi:DNA-binding NarL/FixJ family response regulator